MNRPPIACAPAIFLATLTAAPAAAQVPAGKDGRPEPAGNPHLVPVWKSTTIGLPQAEDFNAEQYAAAQEWVAARYVEVRKDRRAAGKPEIPPAVPVGMGDAVVYSTDRGINLRMLRRVELDGAPLAAGALFWESLRDHGLIRMCRDFKARRMAEDWFKRFKAEARTDHVFHRTLSTSFVVSDGFACFVDEAGLLPPADMASMGYQFGPLDFVVRSNAIRAIDTATGKLVGKLPDSLLGAKPLPRHYLGAPLIEGGLWYLVYETDGMLRLQCFDRAKYETLLTVRVADRESASRVWDTEVSPVPTPLTEDLHRRLHAIYLVKAGGLVLCPTNFGRVDAVEAATGKPKWASSYTTPAFRGLSNAAPEWVVVPPAVVGDKYVYAPADFPELLCLNLADGKKVWSAKKGDGLYPAVVGDQVLVIGEKSVQALNLKDGSERWKADLPGLPCGRGAALGDTYLVPVSEPKTWRGMIAVVDLKAGKVAEVLKPDKDEPIGNLVVHEDVLISQTLTEIAVFPIRK